MRLIFGMTAYNRDDTFTKAFSALTKSVRGRFPICVLMDKHDAGKAMEAYANQSTLARDRFTIRRSEKPLGCAGAHRELFQWMFDEEGADAIVLVEDDGVVAPDFCDVMVEMLERFKDDEEVFSTTAWFSHRDTTEMPDPTALVKRKWFTCHTFGTWRRVWDEIQAAGGVRGVHWRSTKHEPDEGQNFAELLRWDNDDGSWAIPFNHIYRGDRYEVATLLPRMKDIGVKGTFMVPELHSKIMATPFWSADLESFPNVEDLHIEPDRS